MELKPKTMDEWLDETENHSTRRERFVEEVLNKPHVGVMLFWLEAAWKLGAESRASGGLAGVVEDILGHFQPENGCDKAQEYARKWLFKRLRALPDSGENLQPGLVEAVRQAEELKKHANAEGQFQGAMALGQLITTLSAGVFNAPPDSGEVERLREALAEAMEWNWMDEDTMPAYVVKKCEQALAGTKP